MSGKTIKVNQLADEIRLILDDYEEEITEGVRSAVDHAAETVKKEIKANAPAKSGKYKKSWTAKTTEDGKLKYEKTVYSPSRYMLAHLLENGHAKRGGGRVGGIPHIAPAEEKGVEQFEKEIERVIL